MAMIEEDFSRARFAEEAARLAAAERERSRIMHDQEEQLRRYYAVAHKTLKECGFRVPPEYDPTPTTASVPLGSVCDVEFVS